MHDRCMNLCAIFTGNRAVQRDNFIIYIQAMSLRVRTRLKLRMRVKASTNPLP